MRPRVFASVGLIVIAATALMVGAFFRAGGCGMTWGGIVADTTPQAVGTSAVPEEDTAGYWTEERMESAVAAPMPSC